MEKRTKVALQVFANELAEWILGIILGLLFVAACSAIIIGLLFAIMHLGVWCIPIAVAVVVLVNSAVAANEALKRLEEEE